jgi:hypothetical protein
MEVHPVDLEVKHLKVEQMKVMMALAYQALLFSYNNSTILQSLNTRMYKLFSLLRAHIASLFTSFKKKNLFTTLLTVTGHSNNYYTLQPLISFSLARAWQHMRVLVVSLPHSGDHPLTCELMASTGSKK